MPRLCVRVARGWFVGLGLVPGVVSLPFPPSRPACPALRVAGCPVRVSLTLARWYAIPRGLCVPRARSGRPSGAGLEARLIDGDRWYKDNQYLYYEDHMVVPEARLDGCQQWAHLSSGHTGCNRSVEFLRDRFYSQLTLVELRARMQPRVDSCGCHGSTQRDSHERGLVSSLPIPYCANSVSYVDFIHRLPKFGGYDSCLVVTCGLTRFTRAFPCTKKITGEQTVNTLVEQWFEHYRAPKEVHSDEDVRISGNLSQRCTPTY